MRAEGKGALGAVARAAALSACLAAGLAGALAAAEPARELTLEWIFDRTGGPPSPAGFAWSPDGSRLAWLQAEAEGGTPLLHVRAVPGGKAARLTDPEPGPAAVEVSAFRWSPDGRAILAEADGDLWLFEIPASGGAPAPRRLTSTEGAERDARIGPDGRRAAFVRDGDLHVIDLATGSERRLTQGEPGEILNGAVDWVYEEEFSISSAWWWSPDGARIAYLQFDERPVPRHPIVDWLPVHPAVTWQAYPKAGDPNPIVRAGVVEVDGPPPAAGTAVPSTLWMDLGPAADAYLPRAGWSASGSRLLVQKLDRDQTHLDLMACDPATGRCERILAESDRHWINIGDDFKPLAAAAGGAGLVWGAERDGWRHLYLHRADGSLLRRLTEGAWEVTELCGVDERSGWVHFVATEKDPRERHLYRIRLDGTGMRRLTRDAGWHQPLVAPGSGAFVDTHSTETVPPVVTLRGAEGGLLETLDDAQAGRMAGVRLAAVEHLTVKARDGAELPAMMWKPPSFDPSRRHPVLVYVYGGPHVQTATRSWGGPRGLWHHYLARRGVIVWTLDNRGAAGRGHAWETPLHREMGKRELSDQLDGVAWLRTQPYVDPDRIGIWGWSYGGYMTLYALTRSAETFAMGVSVAPVTDWRDYDTIYTERYMDHPGGNPDGYRASAPLTEASKLSAPLLLVHGTADDNVHMQNSVQMLDALIAAGRPVEFALYPGKGHGIAGREARLHLFRAITSFVEAHLKPGR
ncbi:MAG TPA: S9 family peptidase [Candidatus Polarisedimenticolia bacterium]|nr:S9 family peptidase [Candidatus Polarisedimenticolia bacterium]